MSPPEKVGDEGENNDCLAGFHVIENHLYRFFSIHLLHGRQRLLLVEEFHVSFPPFSLKAPWVSIILIAIFVAIGMPVCLALNM